MPSPKLLGKVAVDAIAVAVVSFAVSISMALIFAQRLGYRVRANQELLAQVQRIYKNCVINILKLSIN